MVKIKMIIVILILWISSSVNKWTNASEDENNYRFLNEKFARLITNNSSALPSLKLLQTALSGYELLKNNNLVTRTEVMTIIDFTLPSNKKRLWVLDLVNAKILFHCLVSHGRNSGDENAESFSNQQGSYASSPGFYITSKPYEGRNGLSLALNGIEKGINDNALKRGIVIHGADYVSYDFINKNGRLGRSQGCPAVPKNLNKDIIEAIERGSCLFAYTLSDNYIANSQIIREVNSEE